MKTHQIVTLCCLLITFFNTQLLAQESIQQYLEIVKERYEIPGMAVAVIQKGEVKHQYFLGKTNLDQSIATNSESLFDLHSLSKVIATTAVFQLIEKNLLSLEDPITTYIADLPQAWHDRKVKHLLTFSSGLPEIVRYDVTNEAEAAQKLYQDKPYFEAGEHFEYNQTNYWLLNKIVRKVTGGSISTFIQQSQFAEMPNGVAFSGYVDKSQSNIAIEYFWDGEGKRTTRDHQVPDHLLGAGGILVSLDAFTQWNNQLDNNQLLKANTKKLMWSDFDYEDGSQRPYGWIKYMLNDRPAYGFSGGGIAGFKKFEKDDLAIIVLTNGYKYRFNIDQIIERIAGMITEDLFDQKLVIADQLFNQFSIQAPSKFKSILKMQLKANPDINLESTINSLGYDFLFRQSLDKAKAIFHLNVDTYPDSWNVYDSLAECYERLGDAENAKIFYKKSLEKNPENGHAKERLRALTR